MQVCPRCARQNEDDVRFCGRCGLDFAEYAKHQERPASSDTKFCYKHPKEATNLSCGRCDKPLCTKCVIIGPAGPRCAECAKHHVEFRPGAVLHRAKSGVKGVTKMGPWGIYILVISASMIFGMFRGCGSNSAQPQNDVPIERSN
ncbi:MAG: hypothetical protein CBB60_008720 [Armatimonadetes bacterium Cent15-Ar3]|nr:MAG: hypothetical protein CBB60_008720 [Armatimonadetes bacterium Cent15-Ar3]